jgi:hypothetical protein
MSAGLYDPAFSTLGRIYGLGARMAITAVTLFGGFSSTVCWPLSAFLAARFGWRGVCITYVIIQVVVALPIHLLALPKVVSPASSTSGEARKTAHLQPAEYVLFGLLAVVLTIGAAILAMMGTHLLPILTAIGLQASVAVGFGMMLGPAQVGARVFELLFGNQYNPLWTLPASAILVAIAILMLIAGFPIVALSILLYGAGNGIGLVARGTVPLALFGAERYPVLMGRLGLPLLLSMAVSPYLGGLAFQKGGAQSTLALLAALALANVVIVGVLLLVARIK